MLIQQLVHRMRIKYNLSQDRPHTLLSFVGRGGRYVYLRTPFILPYSCIQVFLRKEWNRPTSKELTPPIT
jgi:hypothetical protein